MNAPRTVVIGLDGATFDVIDPLTRAGYLPTFEYLQRHGTRAILDAFPDLNSAAAWSSLVTGYNAGEHGIFHFDANWYRLAQKGIKTRPTTGADRKREPFWRILSAAGQRVGVVNVPITFPADPLDGFMLAGMDAPGVSSRGFCAPASLYEELCARGIPYEIDTFNLARLAQEQPYRLPEAIKRMTDARARAVLYLMDRHAWDTLMAVFVATDRVQHFFWYDENEDVDAPSWTSLRELYQQLDQFLEQVLARLDGDSNLLIVSDHGFGRKRRALHALNELFARRGWLHYSEHPRAVRGTLLAKGLEYGRRLIPLSLQYPLARLFPSLHLRALTAGGFSNLDWGRTKLFADPDGWGIYVNLQGREPEGIVSPDEYETMRQHARTQLLHLRDGDTNRPIVRAVHERERMFHGPYCEHAPDLVVEWDFEVVGDSLASEQDNQRIVVHPTRRSSSDEKWRATHRPDGILIACGPHIQKNQVIGNVPLYAIAPTVLYLQGQPIPQGLDGSVATALFTTDHLRAHPIRMSETETVRLSVPAAPDARDLFAVEERLRALGYLDSE